MISIDTIKWGNNVAIDGKVVVNSVGMQVDCGCVQIDSCQSLNSRVGSIGDSRRSGEIYQLGLFLLALASTCLPYFSIFFFLLTIFSYTFFCPASRGPFYSFTMVESKIPLGKWHYQERYRIFTHSIELVRASRHEGQPLWT